MNYRRNFFALSAIIFLSLDLIFLIAIFMRHGQTESSERTIYQLFFLTGPLLAWLVFNIFGKGAGCTPRFHQVLLWNGLLLVLFGFILMCAREKIRIHTFQIASALSVLGSGLLLWKSLPLSEKMLVRAVKILDMIFLPFFTLTAILSTDMFRAPLFSFFALSNSLTLLGFGISSLLLAMLHSRVHQFFEVKARSLARFWSGLLCFFPFLFLQPEAPLAGYDIYHINAYIGPVNNFLAGRIPFVDIYAQYGTSYIAVAILFKYLLPVSIFNFFLITQLFELIQQVMLLLIVRKLTKGNLFVLLLSISTLFIYNAHVITTPGAFGRPSMGGFRFLPLLLLAHTLISLPRNRCFSIPSLLALIFCLFWSLEILLLSILVFVGFIVLNSFSLTDLKESGRKLSKYLLFLCLLIILFLSALNSAIYFVYGQHPDFRPYAEIIFGTLLSGGSQDFWGTPISHEFSVWIIYLVTYGFFSIMMMENLMRKDIHLIGQKGKLGAILILGILQFSYFVGRSYAMNLYVVSFPLLILVLIIRPIRHQLPAIKARAIASVLVLFFAYSFLFILFTRTAAQPTAIQYFWRKIIPGQMIQIGVNTALSRLKYNIQNPAASLPELLSLSETFTVSPTETLTLMQKWSPNDAKVLTFVHDLAQTPALLYARKLNAYPISNLENDAQSPTLLRKIIAYDVKPKVDAIVYMPTHKIDGYFHNHPLIDKIFADWNMCYAEKGKYVSAMRLVSKDRRNCFKNFLELP